MDRSLAEVLAEGKGLEDLEKEIWEEACEWAKAKVKQTIAGYCSKQEAGEGLASDWQSTPQTDHEVW